MMTSEEKEKFHAGIFVGLVLGVILTFLIWTLNGIQYPEELVGPNYLINHPDKWKVDTIRTITNSNDTTVTYKWHKIKKNE